MVSATKAAKVWEWITYTQFLEDCSDEKLGELLCDEVWAGMRIMTKESDIVAEAIARLKGERKPYEG